MGSLNSILHIPPDEKPFVILVAGYPAEDAQVPILEKKSLSRSQHLSRSDSANIQRGNFFEIRGTLIRCLAPPPAKTIHGSNRSTSSGLCVSVVSLESFQKGLPRTLQQDYHKPAPHSHAPKRHRPNSLGRIFIDDRGDSRRPRHNPIGRVFLHPKDDVDDIPDRIELNTARACRYIQPWQHPY